MDTATGDSEQVLSHLGYPSLRKAAVILGVAASTLSRRHPKFVGVGAQKRLAAWTVMDEAVYFNRRDLNEVAFDLVELAETESPEAAEAVEHEITEFMRERDREAPDQRPVAGWLAEAKRFLPAPLFAAVADVYEQAAASETPGLSEPDPDRA